MTPLIEPRPKTALAWQDEEIAYPDVIRRARARAASMPEAGERVVLFAENCPDWVYAAYGTWVAGAVLVPVDHLSTAPELAYVVDDCRPALVVCSEHTRATVEGALGIASARPRVATFQELQAQAAAREDAMRDAQATAPIAVPQMPVKWKRDFSDMEEGEARGRTPRCQPGFWRKRTGSRRTVFPYQTSL